MDEVLAILHGVESVALSILIWRTLVADREREKLWDEISEIGDYFRSTIDYLLRKTDL